MRVGGEERRVDESGRRGERRGRREEGEEERGEERVEEKSVGIDTVSPNMV